jgi:hypothetical protein
VLFPDIAMAKGIINTSLTIMCPSDWLSFVLLYFL